MNLPNASIVVSEIEEQALFSFARKNPADIVGIRFATKVTPTATLACQNVGSQLAGDLRDFKLSLQSPTPRQDHGE